MDVLNWLQEWYRQNCTDEWEHFYGIKIDTLDNPGMVREKLTLLIQH
ncbi:MAG: immunity 53 family protein [Eubacterium sp.]|nr:immunity 53 family protein [Eubacterium sp.]